MSHQQTRYAPSTDCDVSDCTDPATHPALRDGERIHVCGRHARLLAPAGRAPRTSGRGTR